MPLQSSSYSKPWFDHGGQGGCWYFDIRLQSAQASVFQAIPAGWTAFSYILEGSVNFGQGDNTSKQDQYHTVVFTNDSSAEGIQLSAASDSARLVVIAGEPLDQKVVQHGPFVMTSTDEIRQAFMDYQLGTNGFEGVHEWRSKSAASLR